MPDLAEQIAAIIDPPAWTDRAELRASGRARVLRTSERTEKMDRARRASSLKKAQAIVDILPPSTPGVMTSTDRALLDSLEQRALAAEDLLGSMMRGGGMINHALAEAGETFGYLHACMFGAEQHLRQHGWLKPEICTCQAPPTHMANDCPIHGLDDGAPF